MISPLLSWGLVTVQMLVLGGLIFLGWSGLWERAALSIFALLGLLLFFHTLFMLGLKTFRTRPEPKASACLCERGLYRYLRHPMYFSVLLLALALVLASPEKILASSLGIILMGIFLTKMHFEEKLWKLREPQKYLAYTQETKRIIPFLY